MDKTMTSDQKNNGCSTEILNIDERLEEALGHCRKYFQKAPLPNCHCVNFGRHGSFLPDCQHSPRNSPSQDISQHVSSYKLSKSLQTVPLNNGCTISRGGVKPLQRKNRPDTTPITSRAACNSVRNNVSGKGSVICASDQSNHEKPRKRIKLNSETYTTPMNIRILQSLGLDMSSSSSEEDSPICGRRCTGSAGGPTASPPRIGVGESMSTPPILEDGRSSPLSDTLISLVGKPRKLDGHSCESISKNSNPLIGDISCLSDMLEHKTKSSKDICDRFDSIEKREVKNPVCQNSPAKHFRPGVFKDEKPSVGASVLSKVSAISKDENYVNAVKITPSRSEASCLKSSRRECLERQNVCMSNPCEVQRMAISSPVELQKLTDEASKAITEADDLKYHANRLKSSGLQNESTEIFFEAALKYLDAASRLETHVPGSAKFVALTPSKIYDTTAKLLEYCAEEYENCKDMAYASLAYKCLEASNMQIVYSTDDISNDFSSSQLTESYPLDSRSRSMFLQLLNFAQCANFAMEASRKSQITLGYASSTLEETGSTEVVDCIKRALNYGFHDMKKLLHLVYEAMEALSS